MPFSTVMTGTSPAAWIGAALSMWRIWFIAAVRAVIAEHRTLFSARRASTASSRRAGL